MCSMFWQHNTSKPKKRALTCRGMSLSFRYVSTWFAAAGIYITLIPSYSCGGGVLPQALPHATYYSNKKEGVGRFTTKVALSDKRRPAMTVRKIGIPAAIVCCLAVKLEQVFGQLKRALKRAGASCWRTKPPPPAHQPIGKRAARSTLVLDQSTCRDTMTRYF